MAAQADVRTFDNLKAAVAKGISEPGRTDFVLAIAGIMPFVGSQARDVSAFEDAVDVMLIHHRGGTTRTPLARRNIRVNTVHPTSVASPMTINEPKNQMKANQPQWAAALVNLLPVNLGEAGDVNEAMRYLCGDSGRNITGIALPVDAGNAVR